MLRVGAHLLTSLVFNQDAKRNESLKVFTLWMEEVKCSTHKYFTSVFNYCSFCSFCSRYLLRIKGNQCFQMVRCRIAKLQLLQKKNMLCQNILRHARIAYFHYNILTSFRYLLLFVVRSFMWIWCFQMYNWWALETDGSN